MSHVRRVILWVKRDARLYDNAALTAAVANGAEVIPLYIEEPLVYTEPDWSPPHTFALHSALVALNKNLRHHESALFVRVGEACAVFDALYNELPFTAIYAHEETGLNHTYRRDQAVAAWCKATGVRLRELPTNGVQRGLKRRAD